MTTPRRPRYIARLQAMSDTYSVAFFKTELQNIQRAMPENRDTPWDGRELVLAGFGTTASVGSIAGSDSRFSFAVTSAGTGQTANPTITITFRDPWGATVPFVFVQRAGGSQRAVPVDATSITSTGVVITFVGTPAAGDIIRVSGLTTG